MRHSSLTAFLNGEQPADAFWREIEPEVRECIESCAMRGSGNIIFTDGPDAPLTRRQMGVFVSALAEGEMPLGAASCIADAIIMSDCFEFEDDTVGDVVHLLADDSCSLTMADVEGVRLRLSANE